MAELREQSDGVDNSNDAIARVFWSSYGSEDTTGSAFQDALQETSADTLRASQNSQSNMKMSLSLESIGDEEQLTDPATAKPSCAVISRLDNVLHAQFGEPEDEVMQAKTSKGSKSSKASKEKQKEKKNVTIAVPEPTEDVGGQGTLRSAPTNKTLGALSPGAIRVSEEVTEELDAESDRRVCTVVAENALFQCFFMILTFYALFVPDVDMLCGSKASKFTLSIVTFVVCIFFVVELFVQSLGRPDYFLRAYFWLDLIATASLLPDTWLFDAIFHTNAFVAGRSSRLTRVIRIASRSSKATRLNRLTRLVRVASLMPKLAALLGKKGKDATVEKLLDKKLRRVFTFLDEDMDGFITRSAVSSCLDKMKADEPATSTSRLWKAAGSTFGTISTWSNSWSRKWTPASSASGGTSNDAVVGGNGHADFSLDGASDQATSDPSVRDVSPPASPKLEGASPPASPPFSPASQASPPKQSTRSREDLGLNTSPSSNKRRLRKNLTAASVVSKPGGGFNVMDEADQDDLISFEEFRVVMLSDSWTASRLRKACKAQLKQGNNMQNLTSKHSEFIAVKVALGVLVLLFVLSMVEPTVEDFSAERGLKHLTSIVRLRYNNQTSGDLVQGPVHKELDVWRKGTGVRDSKRKVLYLDLEKKVYCNEFIVNGPPCEWEGSSAPRFWGQRVKLGDIDDAIMDSDYRVQDLFYINVPNLRDDDLSSEQLDARTMSVVVLHIRGETQKVAVMSILTTILVMVIILLGIVFLTQDLTFLSKNLLKPLRELADDMESIAQMQLAGVAGEDDAVVDVGTSEVRLIRGTFENMKKAIKSWGKYVPWPVVQLLLRANVEADLEVQEMEITMYFSDIAGFTSHVERMRPEDSLLMLSRYFNDMSKAIDDHGGVILEFIGDAIQCIYGAPLANQDHPTNAVKASLRMLAALRRMNEWSKSRDFPEVSIRCGVHTGRVLVGNMGFNMGFHSRMKYGIVGEDSHIPARLEETNKAYSTKMLISSNTFSKISEGVGSGFITRPIDVVSLRQSPGSAPEAIYEVMDRDKSKARSHPLSPVAELHAQAMEEYRSRDFGGAAKTFAEVGRQMKELNGQDDVASSVMLRRCDAYIQKPPSEDWAGVWDRGSDGH